jgi:hypothetical protein
MTNVYAFYRFFLLILTIYTLIQTVSKIKKFKSYYEKAPGFLQHYFFKKGQQVIGKQVKENSQDFVINLMLLVVLVLLNLVLLLPINQ